MRLLNYFSNNLRQISSINGYSSVIKAYPKAILHECQRSCKFVYLYNSFVYGISDDAVYCIESAMFLSLEK